MEGAKCLLEPNKAQTLAVAVHELATNAAKYGALSVPGGKVRVEWTCPSDGPLTFRWIEQGGPRVTAPEREGFGTLIAGASFYSTPARRTLDGFLEKSCLTEPDVNGTLAPARPLRRSFRRLK
jgi:hypothetical protein